MIMVHLNGKSEVKVKIPYPLGYVEGALDSTLGKYGKKLGKFDKSLIYYPKTEEIGKRRSQILSERDVISINSRCNLTGNWQITYYRSIPMQEVGRNGHYSREIFKDFSRHKYNSTIEHIGIKQEDSDLEMVVTFGGRLGSIDCNPNMLGYISERPYSKTKKRLTKQNTLKVNTLKFFVEALNNYFNTNLKYRDFSRGFCMDAFLVLNQESLDALSESAINYSSPFLNELCDTTATIPKHRRKKFRTAEMIEMIVDNVYL